MKKKLLFAIPVLLILFSFLFGQAGRPLRTFDTDFTDMLTIKWNENDTSNRTFNLTLNSGDRTFALHANLTVEATSLIDQDLTTDSAVVQFLKLGIGAAVGAYDFEVTGTSNFGGAVTGIAFNEIENPTGNIQFNMTTRQIRFLFTNPAVADGGFEIEAQGAFSGDLVHIHQHTGNPSAVDLMHLEADGTGVLPLRVEAANASIEAINIVGFTTFGGNIVIVGNSITGTSVDINNAELQQLSAIGGTTISGTQWGYLGAMGAGGGQLIANITTVESTQIEAIGAVTITNAQWAYLGGSDQGFSTGLSPTYANLSLGTGELTAGSINRGSGTLTLEIGGTAEVSITSTLTTFGGDILADTARLSDLTDGYIPYHVSDASGLANSPIRTDGTRIGIGGVASGAAVAFKVFGDITTGATQYSLFSDSTLSGTTASYGLYIAGTAKASTAITDWYGIQIGNAGLGGGASITNQYGLYIAEPTRGGTINEAIHVVGGTSYFGGTVGIGTSTIPHGGVGYAMFAIDGANASVTGPHIQITTSADPYPLLAIFNLRHDDIRMYFDSYVDDAGHLSSDIGSNFAIFKGGSIPDTFRINYASGTAPGAVLTWNDGIVLNTSGLVTIAGGISLTGGSITGTSVDINNTELQQLSAIGGTTISGTQWGYLGAMGAGGGQLIANITTVESTQIEAIGAVTITNAQWAYLGGSDQGFSTGLSPTFANLSLGTGELTAGSINRASGTLTLEIGGTAVFSLGTTAIFTQNSDTLTITLPGTEADIGWSDGQLIFETDEGTNTITSVTVRPKGTNEESNLYLRDTNSWNVRLYTSANRGFITSANGDLGINDDANESVTFFENAITGENPTISISGYETGVALRTSTMRVDSSGDFRLLSPNGDTYIEYIAFAGQSIHEIMHLDFDAVGGKEFHISRPNDDVEFRLFGQDEDIYFKVNDGGVDTEILRMYGATSTINMPTTYGNDMNGDTYRNLLINDSGELGYDGTPAPDPMPYILDLQSYVESLEARIGYLENLILSKGK